MNFFGYYVLNLEPTILGFIGKEYAAPDWLTPNALIEHVSWWHGNFYSMLRRKHFQRKYKDRGIHHSLMVHAPDEEFQRKLFRVTGNFISQNIYIDYNTFKPTYASKNYESIYIAQLAEFKRHFLARSLANVLMVAGQLGELERYKAIVPAATFADHSLTRREVAEAINSAYCSLALSKVEGGMLASFESLLCGVPVVSTRAKGGRHVFLNSGNSITVASTCGAVAAGVRHFCENPPDPNVIRSVALRDLEPHRRRFCAYLSNLSVSFGGKWRDPSERYERYFGGLGGLTDFFIWADKLDNPTDTLRIQGVALKG